MRVDAFLADVRVSRPPFCQFASNCDPLFASNRCSRIYRLVMNLKTDPERAAEDYLG